ncbi:MAG: extracellular solute-binding protein, partial [Ktedonobacteraceae bacterium]|nr:extracellular solute-binding protein [Ktedonobacteraceae bacterium]
ILLLGGNGCGLLWIPGNTGTQDNDRITLTLWYRNRSLDNHLLAQISRQFPSLHLQAIPIGGDFDAKFRTTLAGRSNVPDIVALNANIAGYFPDEDQFVDLRTLGADAIKKEYLGWKWNMAITPGGRLIALPIDTGPTALFYRHDLFQQAGLPADPETVSAQLSTWDAYLQAGQRLQRVTHGKRYLLDDISAVFQQCMSQSDWQFFDAFDHYIGDQSHVRRAWNYAIQAHQLGLDAQAIPGSTEWNAAVNNGTIASFVGASWMKQRLLQAAPATAGRWRIARAPGGAGNNGGSFLAITKYSAHPREAYAVMQWLLSPRHQAQSYVDNNLFPSALTSLEDPRFSGPEAFFGGQNTTQVFSQAAQQVKTSYFGPASDIVMRVFQLELSLVATQNKPPKVAWSDAQQEIRRELSH